MLPVIVYGERNKRVFTFFFVLSIFWKFSMVNMYYFKVRKIRHFLHKMKKQIKNWHAKVISYSSLSQGNLIY